VWLGLGITLALAPCYPIALRMESSVAVASAVRWLTAGLFFIISLALSFRIQRIDRGKNRMPQERLQIRLSLFLISAEYHRSLGGNDRGGCSSGFDASDILALDVVGLVNHRRAGYFRTFLALASVRKELAAAINSNPVR
jgi:hypothetical protein